MQRWLGKLPYNKVQIIRLSETRFLKIFAELQNKKKKNQIIKHTIHIDSHIECICIIKLSHRYNHIHDQHFVDDMQIKTE